MAPVRERDGPGRRAAVHHLVPGYHFLAVGLQEFRDADDESGLAAVIFRTFITADMIIG